MNYYYPLKIETRLTYMDLCEKVQKSIDSILYDYSIRLMEFIKNNEEEIKKEFKQEDNINFFNLLQKPKRYKANEFTDPSLDFNLEELIAETQEESNKIKLTTEAAIEYDKQHCLTERDYNYSIRVYGSAFSNTQTRIDFPIFKVKLCNNEYVWLSACLYVFRNKMAVIKIALPLSNVYTDYLCEYEYDKYISSIGNEFCLKNFNDDKSVECIKNCFIELLKDVDGIKGIYSTGELSNIILSDYDSMPNLIEESDDKLNKALYKIICAPINEMNRDLINEAKTYVDANFWGMHGVKYITSTNGRCLSVVDKKLQEFAISDYMSDNDLSAISNDERSFVIDNITQDIRINVEFAILILMLKKLNNSYSLFLKNTEPNKLHEANSTYNEGVIYINSLLSNVYGTVREQIECFERIMIYYLDEAKVNQNKEAIDNILLQEKARQEQKLNNKLTIGSFLLTLFFGLKAINETLCFIRPYLKNIIGGDIANVTISDVSFGLWICLVILMIVLVIAQYGKVGVTIKMVYAKLKNHFKK